MTPLADGERLQIKVGTWAAGQAGINISHWRVTNVIGASTTDGDVAEQIDALTAPLWKSIMSTFALYYGVWAQIIKPVLCVQEVHASNFGTGTRMGNLLPTAVCGMLQLKSNHLGRSGRGRQWLPFPSTSDVDAGTGAPTAAYITAISAVGGFFQTHTITGTGLDSVDIVPVITHLPAAAPVFDISDFRALNKFGTLHRRGAYGKGNVYPPF